MSAFSVLVSSGEFSQEIWPKVQGWKILDEHALFEMFGSAEQFQERARIVLF